MFVFGSSTDNRALHELRDDLKSLVKSLDNYSQKSDRMTGALFLIALIQTLIAFFQLLLSFAFDSQPQEKILGIAMIVGTLVVLWYFMKRVLPEQEETDHRGQTPASPTV